MFRQEQLDNTIAKGKLEETKQTEATSVSSCTIFQQNPDILSEFLNPRNEQKLMDDYRKMNEMEPIQSDEPNQFLNLVKSLGNISEEILLISLGCTIGKIQHSKVEQQLPTFIRNISKTNNTRVLLIDPTLYNTRFLPPFSFAPAIRKVEDCPKDTHQYQSTDRSYHLKIEGFSCSLPTWDTFPRFYLYLQKIIENILSKNGKVFIANHLSAYSLTDLPEIAIMYNNIKKLHPHSDGLQLYTQAGSGTVRYYLNKLYNHETSKSTSIEMTQDHLSDAFFSCKTIADLATVPAFSNSPSVEKDQDKALRPSNFSLGNS